MKNSIYFQFSAALFVLLTVAAAVFPQNAAPKPPRQEKLLNNLRVLMWSDPAAQNVTMKLRVHNGAAFDPQGKEGVMKLLSDNIFPTEAARDFFTDDLGGTLDIIQNQDYIQIDASSKPDQYLAMLETVANAVTNMTIDKDTTAKLKAAHLEKLKTVAQNPVYVADRAVAARLLGTFPYGRPSEGTTDSVAKIDFADLIFARDRFFTADNATLAVSGNFKSDTAYRAIRRFFGSWIKSDKLSPATFRLPEEPNTQLLNINLPTGGDTEIRYALRGLARSDADFAASQVLAGVWRGRLQKSVAAANGKNAFVKEEAHLLPGLFVFGFTMPTAAANDKLIQPNAITTPPVTDDEFAKAKSELATELAGKTTADLWLDGDTFKLASTATDAKTFNAVTRADVQRVADKISKMPAAGVIVTQKAAQPVKN